MSKRLVKLDPNPTRTMLRDLALIGAPGPCVCRACAPAAYYPAPTAKWL